MRLSSFLTLCVFAGCGGSSDVDSSYFLGEFDGLFTRTTRQTLPTEKMPEESMNHADMYFNKIEGHSFETKDPSDCAIFFDQTSKTTADAPMQECVKTLSDGLQQTIRRSCTATTTGAEVSLSCTGSVSGFLSVGAPYSGTYTGYFSGMRITLL